MTNKSMITCDWYFYIDYIDIHICSMLVEHSYDWVKLRLIRRHNLKSNNLIWGCHFPYETERIKSLHVSKMGLIVLFFGLNCFCFRDQMQVKYTDQLSQLCYAVHVGRPELFVAGAKYPLGSFWGPLPFLKIPFWGPS